MRVDTTSHADPVDHEDPTLQRLSAAERALLDNIDFLDGTDGRLYCPNCHECYRPGELACSHCGILLAAGVKTTKLEGETERPPAPKSLSVGAVFVEDQKPIIFDIGGISM